MIDENDINDDTDDFGDDIDLGFDDFDDDFDSKESSGNTLGDLWRNNPLVKVGVILIAAAVIFGIILMFGGGGDKKSQPSLVTGGSDVSATPGEQGATRDFIAAIQETNENAAEEALLSGGSALPVPIESTLEVLEPDTPETTEEDPLERWRRLQAEREAQVIAAPVDNFDTGIIQQEIDTGAAEALQAMAEAMSQQMQAILENQTDAQVSHRSINTQAYLDNLEAERLAAEEAAAEQIQEQAAAVQAEQNTILPAGEILYAQLITEANSDAPGPVVAQIASGPLNGARVLGDFEVQNTLITLNFNTIVLDGVSTSIDAVALDPNTTLPGMATEVNHRYFQRIVLPAAAAFIEGAADAIAESGRTTITIEGETVSESTEDADTEQEISSGISELGREAGDILDEIANDTEVLVRIDAGTPIGLLFLEPIIEGNDAAQNTQSNLDVLPQ